LFQIRTVTVMRISNWQDPELNLNQIRPFGQKTLRIRIWVFGSVQLDCGAGSSYGSGFCSFLYAL